MGEEIPTWGKIYSKQIKGYPFLKDYLEKNFVIIILNILSFSELLYFYFKIQYFNLNNIAYAPIFQILLLVSLLSFTITFLYLLYSTTHKYHEISEETSDVLFNITLLIIVILIVIILPYEGYYSLEPIIPILDLLLEGISYLLELLGFGMWL